MWDPVALRAVKEHLPEVECIDDLEAAIDDAHALVVATEWDEVRALSPERLRGLLGYPIVIDGRNVFEPTPMLEAGLHYHPVGRANHGL
jgi:UDPglucose 6-dehydrogenase